VNCCAVCERELDREYDVDLDGEAWCVVYRNGLFVRSCLACWQKWPDGHKRFPATGFGRWPGPKMLSADELERLVDVLEETAS
jgi:hypothetical protein